MINLGTIKDQTFKMPVYSTTDIAKRALLMPGVTAETDLGCAILATNSAAAADAIGMTDYTFDVSEEGSTTVTTGATWPTATIKPCFEATLLRVEMDQADTAALAGAESSKTITITSLEDNIDTSWLYCVGGTGIGQLRYVGTSASGSCDISDAGSPEWDTGDTVIKIPRIFHQVVKLNSAGTKIGTDAGAGSWTVVVMRTWLSRNANLEQLYPPTHKTLSGLNATAMSTKFYVDLCARNTAAYTTE